MVRSNRNQDPAVLFMRMLLCSAAYGPVAHTACACRLFRFAKYAGAFVLGSRITHNPGRDVPWNVSTKNGVITRCIRVALAPYILTRLEAASFVAITVGVRVADVHGKKK